MLIVEDLWLFVEAFLSGLTTCYTTDMEQICINVAATGMFGQRIGRHVHGGDVIELVGDVGAGKTALTKAIALGMGIDDDVQSPTFTISRVYDAPSAVRLAHYDFYRLTDAGILSAELAESTSDQSTVTVVEWGEIVEGVLPKDRLTIRITPRAEDERVFVLEAGGPRSRRLLQEVSI